MTDYLRICGLLDLHQVVQRNHFPGVGAQVILRDIFGRGPKPLIGLHVNAVRAIVEIKVIHIHRAHVHLQRIGNLVQRHLQALGLFPVDVHQVLRIVRGEAGKKSGKVGARPALQCHLIRGVRQRLQRVATLVFQYELESAELAQSLDGRWIERDHQRFWYPHQRTTQPSQHGGRCMPGALSFSKRFQRNKDQRAVGRRAGEAEAPDGKDSFDLGYVRSSGFHLAHRS